jgi:anti-sigma factor RsiW
VIAGSGRGSHLGDIVAALIDGELGIEARDRALAHAAACGRCSAEVAAERRLKATLRSTATPDEPVAGSFLLASLLEIPMFPTAVLEATREQHRVHGPRRPRHPYLVGAGCAASVVLGFAGAAALGSSSGGGHLVSPSMSTFTVENAATTGEVPLTDADLQAAVTVAFRGR